MQLSMSLHVSLCMRRTGRFDLPGELAPTVQPAIVVPVPRDIPTEGGTSRCASQYGCPIVGVWPGSIATLQLQSCSVRALVGAIHHMCSTSYRHQCGTTLSLKLTLCLV